MGLYFKAREKADNVYADSRHAFGVAHGFGMWSEQGGFLASRGNKM